MKTISIDGHDVKLCKLPARQGWKVLHKLGRLLGPSIAEASNDNFGQALSVLFEKSESEEVYSLIEELGKQVIVDNNDLDLSKYGLTIKCIKELIMYNFEDFFSPLGGALKSFKS